MKQWVIVLMLAGALATAGVQATDSAEAQATAGQSGQAGAGQSGATVMPPPSVPSGEVSLGTVRIPRSVRANNEPLAAGSYQIRLTPEEAKPDVVGQTAPYERWAEFVSGGQVRGREVAIVVPQEEIGRVAEDAPPRPGASKVQMLRGNDYLRVWVNRDGTHYLIYLVPA